MKKRTVLAALLLVSAAVFLSAQSKNVPDGYGGTHLQSLHQILF